MWSSLSITEPIELKTQPRFSSRQSTNITEDSSILSVKAQTMTCRTSAFMFLREVEKLCLSHSRTQTTTTLYARGLNKLEVQFHAWLAARRDSCPWVLKQEQSRRCSYYLTLTFAHGATSPLAEATATLLKSFLRKKFKKEKKKKPCPICVNTHAECRSRAD